MEINPFAEWKPGGEAIVLEAGLYTFTLKEYLLKDKVGEKGNYKAIMFKFVTELPGGKRAWTYKTVPVSLKAGTKCYDLLKQLAPKEFAAVGVDTAKAGQLLESLVGRQFQIMVMPEDTWNTFQSAIPVAPKSAPVAVAKVDDADDLPGF